MILGHVTWNIISVHLKSTPRTIINTLSRSDDVIVWTSCSYCKYNESVCLCIQVTSLSRDVTVMAAITRLVLVGLLMTTLRGLLADKDEIDQHRSAIGAPCDLEIHPEIWKGVHEARYETVLKSSSRPRRALRQVKVIEILETQRNVVTNLGNDYTERFTFKAPAPRHLTINPVMGAINVRDGQKLDFETEPEINFTVLITKVDNNKCKSTINLLHSI